VSYSDHLLSVVLLSLCLTVNFYIFNFSRTTWPILSRLGTNHPFEGEGEGSQLCSNEGERPSPTWGNTERVKTHWEYLKIFFRTTEPKNIFFRTTEPNSIKLGTNYPWVKRIQACSDKGQDPLQRGDNHKNVNMGWGHFKIFFTRSIKPEELILHGSFLI
jgi:hypothetical protein